MTAFPFQLSFKQEYELSSPIGSIVHLEIFAKNVEISAKFYTEMFGWKTTPIDNGWMLWEDTSEFGGDFTTSGAPIPSSTTFYIHVEDIEAALEKVERSGGKLIKGKTEIGQGFGFYALCLDPAGNHIGLWCKN